MEESDGGFEPLTLAAADYGPLPTRQAATGTDLTVVVHAARLATVVLTGRATRVPHRAVTSGTHRSITVSRSGSLSGPLAPLGRRGGPKLHGMRGVIGSLGDQRHTWPVTHCTAFRRSGLSYSGVSSESAEPQSRERQRQPTKPVDFETLYQHNRLITLLPRSVPALFGGSSWSLTLPLATT
jgi:hypothetical protein